MLDRADPTDAQLGVMPLADQRDYPTGSDYIAPSIEMSGNGIDNESESLEAGDVCFDAMLDMEESADLGDEMLDDLFLGVDVVCGDDELLCDDEILNEDINLFEDETMQIHEEDLDDDLFCQD